MQTITNGFEYFKEFAGEDIVNKSICDLYLQMNIPEPKIVWFDSVMAAEYLLGLKREFWPKRLPDRQNIFSIIQEIGPPETFWHSLNIPMKKLRTYIFTHDSSYAPFDQLISMLYAEVYKNTELSDKIWLNNSLLSLMPVSLGRECIPKQFDMSWIMKFDSFVEQLNFINRNCFCYYPFGEYVLAVKFPKTIKINDQRMLHCDDGPATVWEDGSKTWHLNGVFVPHWIVDTPAQEIAPQSVLEESNTMVRKEIIRKVGIERFVDELKATSIEQESDYELLEIRPDFNIDKRPGNQTFGFPSIHRYLKMRNPSTGEFHLEGVPPESQSIKEALTWRNQTDETPLHIT